MEDSGLASVTFHKKIKGGTNSKCLRLGAVYTPVVLASWAASVLASMIGSERVVALDPACGDGALLVALRSQGVSRLTGVDCDPQAVELAAKRVKGCRFHQTDGLEFLANAARGEGTVDAVIANPPWGAALKLPKATLASMGYRTVWGQTDSWDLFVEGILRAAKPHAPIVLILPDALFLPEHRFIREILATESEITKIARLGEGFFPSVYRGVVVIATRKGVPKANATVTCARLSPENRRDILAGYGSLSASLEESSHQVLQSRFRRDPEYRFDIDARKDDHAQLSAFDGRTFPWDDWLQIGRGVELSKTGRIVRCPLCATARPFPKIQDVTCNVCGHRWKLHHAPIETIICRNNGMLRSGWHPLIVGEDVDRHACSASRMIRLGVSGIRYKPLSIFAQPKLLVRKTGVGIKAVVDDSGAATNQVVFHFACKPKVPVLILDYLAGVLCSRVMLAWHLKRQGEIEWRSHPYITPRMVRYFPVPVPDSVEDWAQVRAIANAVKVRRSVGRHDSPEDMLIERLVAGMFGLSPADMKWILGVIESVQQLEPIRTLKLSSADLVSPLRVASSAA